MNAFKSEKFIPIGLPDYRPVAEELAAHFKQRNYQVECGQLPSGEWEVGITRGGLFKAAVGLKSALKVQIEGRPAGTLVRAGAGIFGKQAIPTAISMLVAWPVLLPQIWGLIREAGLDDEAVRVVEVSLSRAQRVTQRSNPGPGESMPGGTGAQGKSTFCTSCGRQLDASAQFCSGCGKPCTG